MTIIGNLLLLLATLCYLLLLSIVYGRQPAQGGDAVVGYLWSLLFFLAGFAICMAVVAIFIGLRGQFAWIAAGGAARFLLVCFGLLSSLVTVGCSLVFKREPGFSGPAINFTFNCILLIVPVLMISTGFILLNNPAKLHVPLALYKWPMVVLLLTGSTGVVSALVAFFVYQEKRQSEAIQATKDFYDANDSQSIRQIDSCDVLNNMVSILVFTDSNQSAEVYQHAIAKVKSHPAWEQALIGLLNGNGSIEAFTFLASNSVDHPELFKEPVRNGLVSLQAYIRRQIRRCSHPSHFYPDFFRWEVERAIRTVDRFSNQANYLNEVKELRAALDEPSEFKKPDFRFAAAMLLDRWIKQHQ